MNVRQQPKQRTRLDEESARHSSAALITEDAAEGRAPLVLYASFRPSLVARRPQLMSLSTTGLIVRAHKLLSPGQRVRVTIHLLDTGCDVELEARVLQVNHPLGEMTMQIVTVDGTGSEAIAEYIGHPSAPR